VEEERVEQLTVGLGGWKRVLWVKDIALSSQARGQFDIASKGRV